MPLFVVLLLYILYINEIIWYLFFFWFTSLNVITSSFQVSVSYMILMFAFLLSTHLSSITRVDTITLWYIAINIGMVMSFVWIFVVLGVDTKKCNLWVIWQYYFYFSEKNYSIFHKCWTGMPTVFFSSDHNTNNFFFLNSKCHAHQYKVIFNCYLDLI